MFTPIPKRRFLFTHSSGAKRMIRAHDEESARRKMKAFLRDQIFGPFALFFDPLEVDRHMQDVTCKEIHQ